MKYIVRDIPKHYKNYIPASLDFLRKMHEDLRNKWETCGKDNERDYYENNTHTVEDLIHQVENGRYVYIKFD